MQLGIVCLYLEHLQVGAICAINSDYSCNSYCTLRGFSQIHVFTHYCTCFVCKRTTTWPKRFSLVWNAVTLALTILGLSISSTSSHMNLLCSNSFFKLYIIMMSYIMHESYCAVDNCEKDRDYCDIHTYIHTYLRSILSSQFSQQMFVFSAKKTWFIKHLAQGILNIAHFWMASLVCTNCSWAFRANFFGRYGSNLRSFILIIAPLWL